MTEVWGGDNMKLENKNAEMRDNQLPISEVLAHVFSFKYLWLFPVINAARIAAQL